MIPLLHQIAWRPTIGDPSAMGWVTVAAYFTTSLLALLCSLRQTDYSLRNFWIGVAIFLLLLGFNKQLDLQSLLTDIGRLISRRQGWYGERREVQVVFVVIAFMATLAVVAMVSWKIRLSFQELLFPLAGLILLIGFITVRMISFHHVDVLLGMRVVTVKMNWLLELGGIGILFIAALTAIVKRSERET